MLRCFGWAMLALLFLALQGRAVITADFPLKAVLKSEQHILIAKVEKLDSNPELPRMVLKVDENLKGKAPFEKLAVNLTAGSAEGKKLNHTDEMLKRLETDLPIVIFASKRGNQYIAFAFTNGTWFQMHGKESSPGTYVWSFMNCEPYLRRTYKGTTADLRQTVIDALAGKKEPPPTNPKEEPGLGPVIGAKGS